MSYEFRYTKENGYEQVQMSKKDHNGMRKRKVIFVVIIFIVTNKVGMSS